MNIFLRELKASLKSLIIWCVIVLLFTLVGFSKFTAYYQKPEMLQILDAMPKQMIEAMQLRAFDMTSLPGFYGVMFPFIALIIAIAAVMWGNNIITKEERQKTVEYSLTMPIQRASLITGKALAAAVDCVVLLAVTIGGIILGAQNYAPDAAFYKFMTVSIPAYLLIQFIFLALGIFLGCVMKNYKQSGGISIGIMLALYFASIIAGLSKSMEFLKYVSPFKYFDPLVMFKESRLEWGYVALSLGIIAVCMVLAYVTYKRRDLYI